MRLEECEAHRYLYHLSLLQTGIICISEEIAAEKDLANITLSGCNAWCSLPGKDNYNLSRFLSGIFFMKYLKIKCEYIAKDPFYMHSQNNSYKAQGYVHLKYWFPQNIIPLPLDLIPIYSTCTSQLCLQLFTQLIR